MILGEIFCDGIVLQQKKPIRVFGTAFGEVAVTLDGETKTVAANGRWVVEFAARPCGGPYELAAVCGEDSVIIRDVMIGEVFLFSGQSNMQFRVGQSNLPADAYKRDPLLRIFALDFIKKGEPIRMSESWCAADPANIANWSALAYMVGAKLRESCGCAVGVIASAQGATGIQTWIDDALFAGEKMPLAYHECSCSEYEDFNGLGQLFHAMIEPLMPISLAGVVWYQGESNARPVEAENYRELLSMMITDWRRGFADAALPFCIVEIADWDNTDKRDSWKLVQEMQAAVAEYVPYAFSVKSADVCETNDIHPPTKHKLAERVADALCVNGVIR